MQDRGVKTLHITFSKLLTEITNKLSFFLYLKFLVCVFDVFSFLGFFLEMFLSCRMHNFGRNDYEDFEL